MSGRDAVTLPVSFSTNTNETEFPCDAVAVVEVPSPDLLPHRVFNMQLPCIVLQMFVVSQTKLFLPNYSS